MFSARKMLTIIPEILETHVTLKRCAKFL